MDYYSEESLKNARKSKWYDDITRTLTKCPFCDLKEKFILWEDGSVVLTMNIFPYIDGHLMVIPRRHVEKFAELSPEEWISTKKLLDLGMRIITEELDIDNINLLYREGVKSGNSLKHLHIHILPIIPEFMRYEKQRFVWEFQDIKFSPVEMATRLRAVCHKLQTNK